MFLLTDMRRLILLCVLSFIFNEALQAADVRVVHGDKGWQLLVDGLPYIIRGMVYSPTKIGENPSDGNWRDWMIVDDNHNSLIDAPYEAWVDQNGNGMRDTNESVVGDFKLMQDMGVNTLRLPYHPTTDPEMQKINEMASGTALRYNHPPNKALLRDLFKTYGIRVAIGDFLGAYTVGSGAEWTLGTDYTDPEQRQNMLHSVEAMVRDFKDEPYVLMWILGNENNYKGNTHTNASDHPEAYVRFVNEVAKRIHALDPHHPVAVANGETQLLPAFAKYGRDIDIFGVNCYRRPGFGTLWREVGTTLHKPVVLTEYGLLKPPVSDGKINEEQQASEHLKAWCDIAAHTDGGADPGNALGGFIFEWVDEWWFNGHPDRHDAVVVGYNNEWHGITGQGNGEDSPRQRVLRQVYFLYKKLWKTGELSCPASAS